MWSKALWITLGKHNYGSGLVRVMEDLFSKSSSPVVTSSDTLEWFETTVKDRRRCILSPCLFNIFLEHITIGALEGFDDQSGRKSIFKLEIR